MNLESFERHQNITLSLPDFVAFLAFWTREEACFLAGDSFLALGLEPRRFAENTFSDTKLYSRKR